MTSPTLVEFLLARLDEDAAAAEAAKDAPEVYGNLNDREAHAELLELARNEGASEAAGAHAARWDPGRVLAECAAKRRIVEHAQRWALTLNETPEGWTEELTTPYRMAMRWTLEQLAQPYSDHPDYREEWRP